MHVFRAVVAFLVLILLIVIFCWRFFLVSEASRIHACAPAPHVGQLSTREWHVLRDACMMLEQCAVNLQDREKIPTGDQVLFFDRERMMDSRSLHSYNVREGSHLVLSPTVVAGTL